MLRRDVISIMTTPLTVPVFRREDWLRIKSSSADEIPGTYDDYICELRKRLAAYKQPDELVVELEVDFDDMLEFLRRSRLANVADNRALYVQSITGASMVEDRR